MKSTLVYTSLFTAVLGAPANFHMRRQNNFQTFSAALGGVEATPVVDSGNADRPFQVKGDTFVNIAAALARSCDQQFNGCANLANAGAAFSVNDCTTQKCKLIEEED